MVRERDGVCRWGILGTAGIARKNWRAIWNASNATLVAVGSRSAARAAEYVDACQSQVPFPERPEAVEGYDRLLARSDVDAVYLPLPTGIRREWAIAAARAGKHVLSEKPAGCHLGEVEEIVAACREHGVQYMDGVMFMHSGRLGRLRRVLDDPEGVGAKRRIVSQFSFKAPDDFLEENIRMSSALEPLGCLGDLGWYDIRFALWTMDWALPERVSGRILSERKRPDSPDTVPVEFSGELFFGGCVSASFYCSFLTENQQWANVSGDRGYVHLDDFVLPFHGSEVGFQLAQSVYRIEGCDFRYESHPQRFAVHEHSDGALSAQETRMIQTFSDLALRGEPDAFWSEAAVKTQRVLDACLASARNDGRLVGP
jgi:predicted dehydrogenase